MKTKSDIQSLNFRQKANRLYSKKGTLEKCMKLYNKSLRYAIYNGENYAKALANRSALLFRMFEYEKSIEDIDLCLKSKCPNSLKPKVYMRKCECYKNLGDRKNLKKTVKEFKLFMNAELSDTIANQYKQKLDDLLSKDEAKVIRFDDDCFELPTMERNPEFEELSVDVVLKNDKKGKFYLASSRSIKKGQVVLLEKAYAFSTNHEKKFCQYCLKKIVNGIPFHDDKVVIKALTDLEPNTKLTYSILMNHLGFMVERKTFLWDVCQIKCNCENCSNPLLNMMQDKMDSFICIKCKGPAINDPTTSEKFKCLSCDYVFKMPPNIEMSMVLAAHFKNRFLVFNDIGMAYDAFNLSKTFLNPYHHFFEELYAKMSLFYLEKGEHGAAFDLLERQLDYIVTRTSKKTVENVLNYIRYSIRILQNIAQQVDIRSDVFKKALVSVEDALEKARELNSYLYPPLMKIIKIQQMLCFYQQLRSLRSN
ncbi:hypothetical protein FQR65_LT01364 [Abscondita terminalis]|nr:hypothetical protein FQR65_LT01364 [Abscondita terminalis]